MTDDTEGFALFATEHPIEVTEAMIAAGEEAAKDSLGFVEWHGDANWQTMLRAVFTAMCRAAPPEPDWDEWPSQGSLVEATVEIKRDLWQPISTAPKDAEAILVAGHWGGNRDAPQFAAESHWDGSDWFGHEQDLVTHWQPLPAPPSRGMDIINNGT